MVAFVSVNEVQLFKKHSLPPKMREEQLTDCVFEANSVGGLPSIFVAVSAVATLLVALVLKQEDTDLLSVSYPQGKQSFGLKCIMDFVWFLQAIYMPGCFAIEAAAMFANSSDSLEVVMNTLAVTFIMDVDNMLYGSILSYADRRLYQEQGKLKRTEEEVSRLSCCTTAIFIVAFVLMMVHFSNLSFIRNLHGTSYISGWQASCFTSYLPLYGSRAALQVWFYRYSSTDGPLWTLCRGLAAFALSGTGGAAWYRFTTFLAFYGEVSDKFKHCADH